MHKHTLKVQPILNPDKRLPRDEARAIAANCTLAGGGWQTVSVQEEVSIRNYKKFGPASDIPGDPKSGYVVTRDDDVSPPAGYVWGVLLGSGNVDILNPSDSAFGRGGRLSPASQEDLAAFFSA